MFVEVLKFLGGNADKGRGTWLMGPGLIDWGGFVMFKSILLTTTIGLATLLIFAATVGSLGYLGYTFYSVVGVLAAVFVGLPLGGVLANGFLFGMLAHFGLKAPVVVRHSRKRTGL